MPGGRLRLRLIKGGRRGGGEEYGYQLLVIGYWLLVIGVGYKVQGEVLLG